MTRVAVNCFGQIGRNCFRALERGTDDALRLSHPGAC